MLIDAILDRMDGQEYSPKALYNYLNGWAGGLYDDVCRALDCGDNEDVQRVLCEYIENEGYNMDICEYIRSVDWLATDGVVLVTCQNEDGESVIVKREKISLNVDSPEADEFLMRYAKKVLPVTWVWDDYMQLVCYPEGADKGVYFLCNFA